MIVKILIVDDDLEIVRSLGNTFTTLLKGYLVLTATTANQGLNYIKQEKPDIIVMDIRLGPVSGMDLLEDYPKHMKDYRPRILVITAYDDEKARKKAEELKVDAFIRKPFVKETLLAKVLASIKRCLESETCSIDFALRSIEKQIQSLSEADKKFENRLEAKPKQQPTDDSAGAHRNPGDVA